MRRAAVAALASAALTSGALRMARATVFERLLSVGSRMSAFLDDSDSTGLPRRVLLSGSEVFLATGRTDRSVADVIRFYDGRYGSADGGLGALVEHLRGRPNLTPEQQEVADLGAATSLKHVEGEGGGDRGFGAFVDLGSSGTSPEVLAERVERFARTGRLGDLATLRYVYAERAPEGGAQFFLMWSSPDLDVSGMTGAETGEVGGRDLEGVGRYPGSTRIFHVEEPAAGFTAVVYSASADPAAVERYYRAHLAAAGWEVDAAFSDYARRAGVEGSAVRFARGERDVVGTFAAGEDGATSVVLVERGHPTQRGL
jgi:hypothetical protein